jgi:hypothetical protein
VILLTTISYKYKNKLLQINENIFDPLDFKNHLKNQDFPQFYGQNIFDQEFIKEVDGLMYTHADGKIKSLAPSVSVLADYLLGVQKDQPLNVNIFDPK